MRVVKAAVTNAENKSLALGVLRLLVEDDDFVPSQGTDPASLSYPSNISGRRERRALAYLASHYFADLAEDLDVAKAWRVRHAFECGLINKPSAIRFAFLLARSEERVLAVEEATMRDVRDFQTRDQNRTLRLKLEGALEAEKKRASEAEEKLRRLFASRSTNTDLAASCGTGDPGSDFQVKASGGEVLA